jgi:hypothetical protein
MAIITAMAAAARPSPITRAILVSLGEHAAITPTCQNLRCHSPLRF